MTFSAKPSAVSLLLLEAAARLLAEEGSQAFSSRNVARTAGTSTMAVYTHFGSMGELVRAIVDEGFQRLSAQISAAPRTGEVRADLTALSVAYLLHARENPHLFRVMFGSAPLGQFGPIDSSQMRTGRKGTLDVVVAVLDKGIEDGAFGPASPWRLANQWFSAVHGYTMLELAGYVRPTDGPEKVLKPLLANLFAGFALNREGRP